MNKLFAANLHVKKMDGGYNITLYVLAESEDKVKDAVLSLGLYDHLIDTLTSEEIDIVKVPYLEVNAFMGKFFGKEFGDQRLGQAFLNHFGKDYPLVEANRHGPYLWEEKNNNVAVDKLDALGLIDWSAN